uniref:DHHA1 domain-containing protein n=1 Tax=Sinosporangium siamense TaxID=1367973 RepID=UPI0023B2CBCC|nr:DHHA1 domain-containing protein [Sinosporangium siamense]
MRKRLAHLATAQQELDRLRANELRDRAEQLLDRAYPSGHGKIITELVTEISAAELHQLALEVIDKTHSVPTVVILGLEHDGKAMLVATISPDLLASGVQAAQIITRAAKAVGGGGGGTGGVASAGGRHPQALAHALQLAADDASSALTGR